MSHERERTPGPGHVPTRRLPFLGVTAARTPPGPGAASPARAPQAYLMAAMLDELTRTGEPARSIASPSECETRGSGCPTSSPSARLWARLGADCANSRLSASPSPAFHAGKRPGSRGASCQSGMRSWATIAGAGGGEAGHRGRRRAARAASRRKPCNRRRRAPRPWARSRESPRRAPCRWRPAAGLKSCMRHASSSFATENV